MKVSTVIGNRLSTSGGVQWKLKSRLAIIWRKYNVSKSTRIWANFGSISNLHIRSLEIVFTSLSQVMILNTEFESNQVG